MNIAIIGAGIAGTATALELVSHGMHVNVFERRSAVAEEGSFANSGLIATSLVRPLDRLPVTPVSFPRKVHPRKGIVLRKGATIKDFLWRYRRCSSTQVQSTQHLKVTSELVALSQCRLREILKLIPEGLERTSGQLLIFQTEKHVHEWQARLENLKELGVGFQILTPHAARKIEPGLSPNLSFHSAILFEQDEVINGRQLAQVFKDEASRLGAKFHFATPVVSLEEGAILRFGQSSPFSSQKFDAVVICSSNESAKLLKDIDTSICLHSVMSYSVSGQIQEPLNAPRAAIFDVSNGVSITRFGSRIRASGGLEMGLIGNTPDNQVINGLYQSLQDFFPGSINFHSGGQVWRGATSFSNDGLPLVGPTSTKGVWINAGHGMSGLALANASAVLVRDGLLLKSESPCAKAVNPTRFRTK